MLVEGSYVIVLKDLSLLDLDTKSLKLQLVLVELPNNFVSRDPRGVSIKRKIIPGSSVTTTTRYLVWTSSLPDAILHGPRRKVLNSKILMSLLTEGRVYINEVEWLFLFYQLLFFVRRVFVFDGFHYLDKDPVTLQFFFFKVRSEGTTKNILPKFIYKKSF